MSQKPDTAFEAILDYLRRVRGFDFGIYKRSSLMRRMNSRMQVVGVGTFRDYLDYLEVHPAEFDPLFTAILINVTGFWRDAEAWTYLATLVLPAMLQRKPAHTPIRVWSAGCATGEEAYTLAIVLAEALGLDAFRQRVKIYATDLDEEALAVARLGSYRAADLKPLSTEWQSRYFENNGERFVFRSDLRRSVIFGRHDLAQDAPISHLDLLVCRNTLMYFNAEAQKRLLPRFHFALNEQGVLFLGKAEMLLTHSDLFVPLELKHRVFTKVTNRHLADQLFEVAGHGQSAAEYQIQAQAALVEQAFNATPLAQVVVNQQGLLVLANQAARAFFDLKPTDLGHPFHDLELSYRPVELRSLVEQVQREQRPLKLTNVTRVRPTGEVQSLDIQITQLHNNNGLLMGVTITFTDVTSFTHIQQELERTNHALETAYEELQSTNEELETVNEELQSTVEELETTNEELQSTNEEMETINEELQSTNAELQTLNTELNQSTTQLNLTNAFLHSILAGLRDGVVVVDTKLTVVKWNQRSEDLWGLRAEEVQERSLFSLDIGLPVVELKDSILNCLAGKHTQQTLLLNARNRRGKTIQCRVTCTALRDQQGERQGVILVVEEVARDEGS